MQNFKPLITYSIIAIITLLIAMTYLNKQTIAPKNSTVLYLGARLIIGDGSIINNGALLIQDQKITAVGSISSMNLLKAVNVVDVSGKTIIPALIDAHAHLGYEGYSQWGGKNYTQMNLIKHLKHYAYYGFTAVFSAGTDAEDLAQEVQKKQLTQYPEAAQLLFAAGMGPPNQGPYSQFLEHITIVTKKFGQVVLRGLINIAQARKQVHEIVKKKISFIKIWVDNRGGKQEKLRPEIYRALIEEARRAGIKVFAHQQSALDMINLINAGISGFLHGRLEDPLFDYKLANKISKSKVFVVPSLGLDRLRSGKLKIDQFLIESLPKDLVKKLRNHYKNKSFIQTNLDKERQKKKAFNQLLKANADIVLGTDAGAIPNHFFGYSGHKELEIFVELGMTPMQAIMAGTSVASKHLGLSNLGSLSVGKSADFIILNRNPLEDIRNTQAIDNVVLRGKVLNRSRLIK